ncbi:MAG: FAD-binding oxidoreductase [Magnetospirillum gryphiswaldense]|nr:FAD-binding oxidoreductase [Magnetospirillum gryphiswaldense]
MNLIESLKSLLGEAHVLTEAADQEAYVTEERGLYRGQTLAVLRPADTEQLAATMRLCAQAKVAVVPQGGNTGLCGGGVPGPGSVVMSTERLNRIRDIDTANFTMTVEAGCVLATLQQAADQAGCLFPLSLGAEGSCRIGGNLSTNAGGVGVLRYGNTRDLTLGLEVVLADGRVWNGLRSLRKDNTGYDLKHLFIGAEGTLGIITAATLKLFPKPAEQATALIALPDPAAALTVLSAARRQSGDAVTACELVARIGLELGMAHVTGVRDPFDQPYPWYLLLELSSSRAGGLQQALEDILTETLEDGAALDAVLAQSGEQRAAFWRIREGVPEAQKKEGGSIKHDVAVPVSRVPEMIERCTKAVEAAMDGVRVVPFGHVGDGNIHFNLTQPKGGDKTAFLDRWAEMNHIVHDIVAELNGSVSAEHGIGQLKIHEMARYKQDVELDLMKQVKLALDPEGLMNPGKVLP